MAAKVKLGVAPTRRNVFSKEDSRRYKELIYKKLAQWGIDVVGIDWLNEEGLLFSEREVPAVAERFRKEGVDAVFTPHCNFGTEDAVAKLGAKLKLPLLLWGPRDEAPEADGSRLRDTQCGLFATSKVLRRFQVPFTYIVNSRVDDVVFERGVKNFLAAANVVKTFRSLRIGQISTRPGGFWTMICNEGELLERFGVETIPTTLVSLTEGVKKNIAKRADKVAQNVAELKKRIDCAAVNDEQLGKIVSLVMWMEDWAKEERLSGIAIQCWNDLQVVLGIMPCLANGILTGRGIPVTCETDVHGAITSAMLRAAAMDSTPTFFADLTVRHPDNDNSELLWHCGPFPPELKDPEAKAKIGSHFILTSGSPGLGEWKLKGGPLTVARFDGDNGEYKLLAGHAKGVEGPYTRGTYIWVEVNDWPLWEEKFIYGPYVHHVAGIHGHVAPAMYEACRHIPGLDFDEVDPTVNEIRAYLRGSPECRTC